MTEVADFFAELEPQAGGYALPGLAVALFALAFFLAIHSLTSAFRHISSPGAEKQKPARSIRRLPWWRAKLTRRHVEWKRPVEAIEAWGDQSLVAQKNEEFERCMGLWHDCAVTLGKLDKIASHESRPLLRQFEVYRRLKEQSDQRLRKSWDDLRLDMERKLVDGALIARGTPAPALPDVPEAAIKRRKWRGLVLDPRNERALEKGDSGPIRYEALMIGNRKN